MLETHRLRSPVTCPAGHLFTAEIILSIHAGTDPDLFFALNTDGSQQMICPACAASWPLVEAIRVYLPGEGRLLLMIPDALSHRAIELRAAAILALRDAPPEQLTTGMLDLPVLSRSAVENTLSDSVAPAPNPPAAEGGIPQGIARAFADLTSIAPAPVRK